MIQTVLMIVLINIANPAEPSQMVHKSFKSAESCMTAADTMKRITPVDKGLRMDMFCVPVSSLADETTI